MEGLRGKGGEEGWWGRVLTPKSKENKPPSHWTTRNQSWLGVVQSGLLGKAGMGSRRLNLWLNPFANMHGSGERRARQGDCKANFPPAPRCPPPPLPAGVISKGVGCSQSRSPGRGAGRARARSSSGSANSSSPASLLLLFSSGSGLQKHTQKNHSLRGEGGEGEGGGGKGGRRGEGAGGGGGAGRGGGGEEGGGRGHAPFSDWSSERLRATPPFLIGFRREDGPSSPAFLLAPPPGPPWAPPRPAPCQSGFRGGPGRRLS